MNASCRRAALLMVLPLLVVGQSAALAQPTSPVVASQPAAAQEGITVTVLPFATPKGEEKTGQDLGEILSLMIASEPGFVMVERHQLNQAIQEQEISLTGLVETSTAARVGKLVGARIIIVGRVFEMGNSRLMTAKLIGTETSLIAGAIQRGPADQPMDEMALALGAKIVESLRESSGRLLASPDAADPLPGLIARLKGADLPVVAVVVQEQHRGSDRPANPLDPAVETQIKHQLLRAGVVVKDVRANELAQWARQESQVGRKTWPQSLDGVDMVITGQAFSEPAGQVGKLHVASGRAEINAITREDGRIVLASQATTRGIDLGPDTAGKAALEQAGRQLSIQLLGHLAATLSPTTGASE